MRHQVSMKMSTPQEKAQCVECFIETRSDMQIQCKFPTGYGRNLPLRNRIRVVQVVSGDWKLSEAEKYWSTKHKCSRCLTSVNHFNKFPENQSNVHPEKGDHEQLLYTGFCIKDWSFMPERCRFCRNSNQTTDPNTRRCLGNSQSHRGWLRLHEKGQVYRESLLSCIMEGQPEQCEDLGLWKPPRGHLTHSGSPIVIVWCGFLHDCLVGLFCFVEDTVTSTIYRNKLERCTFFL